MNSKKNKNPQKKEYWLSLETYVHISIKRESLLLYNSLTGKSLEYSGKHNKTILEMIRRLISPKNLCIIRLKEEELQAPVISDFIQDIRNFFMGDLIDISFYRDKPIQIMPIINVKGDIGHLKKETYNSVGEGMMEYLTEIFLHICGACDQNCNICNHAHKQFPCCTHNNNKGCELDVLKIKGLIEEIKSSSLINLNILGGNIFTYSKFKELTGIINHLRAQKIYYAHYLNVIEASSNLKFLNPRSSSLKILVPFPLDEEKFKTALETLKNTRLDSKFIFIIQSAEEFEKAEALISSFQIADYEFQPFFNGRNMNFFMEGVFTNKEEVLEAKPKMKSIYTNSVVNSLNFGRLTILSNGHIHANVNALRLGILGKNSIYDVLYKEMYHGKSWRRIRKNVEPCRHCTFEALCPPLSNYTYALGRNNLCHNTPLNEETKKAKETRN